MSKSFPTPADVRKAAVMVEAALADMPLAAIEAELRRRFCAFVILDPDMIREQWRVNQDADDIPAGEPEPTGAELARVMPMIREDMERAIIENASPFAWGAQSDACEAVRALRKESEAAK